MLGPAYWQSASRTSALRWKYEADTFHPGVDNNESRGAQTNAVLVGGGNARFLNGGGIAILVLVEVNIALRHPGARALTILATAAAVAAWLGILFGFRQAEPWVRLLLVAVMGASAIALTLASTNGAAIIPAVVSIVAATRIESRAALVFVVALIPGFLIATGIALGLQPISLLSYGLGLTFAYLAARSNAQLHDEQARTKALLVELQLNRDAQVRAAALNERARIAREIHDVLAHTLAALSVQLEHARVTLDQHGSTEEALSAIERAHHLARDGLIETRRAVSALRGDQIPGVEQLGDLIDQFQRDTGTVAHLQIDGSVRTLEPEVQLALYRTAQEALTNVRKHARAQRVEVTVHYQPSTTVLTVQDFGIKPITNGANQGYGLIGMRERAELLGGSLEAHSTDDGFIVTLTLPA